MKVLETRKSPDGYVRRRRRTAEGADVWTIEVPEEMWETFNRPGRFGARNVDYVTLKLRALEHLRDGWKPVASAHDLELPVRTIQRWRKECLNATSANH